MENDYPHGRKPSDFPVFEVQADGFEVFWKGVLAYLRDIGPVLELRGPVTLKVSMSIMTEIFARIEQRRIYYHVFHNGLKMSERKQGALFCYWVLKLMPFRCDGKPNTFVNGQIARCAFIKMLQASAQRRGLKFLPRSEVMDGLRYIVEQLKNLKA